MSDIQTTQDLHAKFIHLIKHYAKLLVEDKVYSLEAAACQGIISELEDDFLEEYAAELTEDEMHWFYDNRFNLDLPKCNAKQVPQLFNNSLKCCSNMMETSQFNSTSTKCRSRMLMCLWITNWNNL